MRKNLISMAASAALLASLASPALAGGSAGSIGVGAEYTMLGIGGVSMNYDAGAFHAGGFLGYRDDGILGDPARDEIHLGGRFFYHVHSTAMSDFGVGAGLGLAILDYEADGVDSNTVLSLDIGAQTRAFIASNVAVSLTFGFTIETADGDALALHGDLLGVGGVHYYFF